jgi:hypothetical protein
MILLMQDIEFSVLIAFSIILGYIIGVITQEELEEISKKLYITKIFNYFFIVAEIIILAIILKFTVTYYFLIGGIFVIANLSLSMFYSAEKADLQIAIKYMVALLVSNLIIGAIIII